MTSSLFVKPLQKLWGGYFVTSYNSKAAPCNLVQLLILALRDESSKVRRRCLSCIKAAAKINHSALATHISILGPTIVDTLKDSSTPVRLAAERCAVHVFQLTKGGDNVSTAQKYPQQHDMHGSKKTWEASCGERWQ